MSEIIYRKANSNDIPFLAETIIEAEKSGTDKLTYSTIFGLTEEETKKLLMAMLEEEVDDCELSVSGFLVAEDDGQTVAAASAWVEGKEGISSSELKGNLLSYFLPNNALLRAAELNPVLRTLHLNYQPKTIQVGATYVKKEYRGRKLCSNMVNSLLSELSGENPDIKAAYAQVFASNTAVIKANEKMGFFIETQKESNHPLILSFLPFNKKFIMKKELTHKDHGKNKGL